MILRLVILLLRRLLGVLLGSLVLALFGGGRLARRVMRHGRRLRRFTGL